MQSNKPNTIQLPSREQVLKPSRYRRLQMTIRAFSYSRRRWLDELEKAIYGYSGQILDEYGREVQLNVGASFDWENRWLSNFLQIDSEGNPKSTCTRSVHKLQLLCVFLLIRHPNLYARITQ